MSSDSDNDLSYIAVNCNRALVVIKDALVCFLRHEVNISKVEERAVDKNGAKYLNKIER